MKAILNGLLWIPGKDVTAELLTEFTYISPFPDQEPIVSYRPHTNGFIGFPAGSQKVIEEILNVKLVVEDKRTYPKFDSPCTVKFGEPRDYQRQPIVELRINDRSIFTAPTSSGKTTAISFLAAELGVKLIVISHLTILLDQIEDELRMFLDADIGRLTSSSKKVHDISLVTVQTLTRSPELQKLVQKSFGLVYVDEFENLLSTNYINAIQRLHAKKVIFTSATPSRDLIGLTPLVGHLATDIVTMTPAEGAIVPVTAVSVPMTMYVKPGRDIRRRAKILKNFYSRQDIRDAVVEIIQVMLDSPRDLGVWLICNIKEEQDYYAGVFEKVGVIASHISKKKREQNLEDFKSGKLDVVIGSATMSAGISIPRMGFVVRLCTHSSSSELLTQQLGRPRRKYGGKQRGIFIDLVFEGLSDRTRKVAYQHMNEGDAHVTLSYDKLLEVLRTKL